MCPWPYLASSVSLCYLDTPKDISSLYTSSNIRDGQQADIYALGIILCELVTCFGTQIDRSKVCSYCKVICSDYIILFDHADFDAVSERSL